MHQKVQERLDRARDSSYELFVQHDDPFVIELESDDSTYTIVPNVAYCSCPDRQYRNMPCKHLFYVAQEGGPEAREALRSGFDDKAEEIIEHIAETDHAYKSDREGLKIWHDAFKVMVAASDTLEVTGELQESERARESDDRTGYLIPIPDDREPETDEIERIASTVSN